MDAAHFLLFTVGREWVWGLFLNGFCVHLARPLVLLVVFAITFAGVGRGIGLPALFLRPKATSRFVIGAGVGVLVWQAVLAGYLFEEFATNYTVDRPPFCEVQPRTGSVWSYADADYSGVVTWPGREEDWEAYRYRYAPASVESIGRYAGGVGAAALAVGVIGLLGWAGRAAVISMRGGGGGSGKRETPLDPWVVRSGRYVGRRIPFVAGIVAGALTAAGIAYLFLPNDLIYACDVADASRPVQVAYTTGARAVDLGGWGNAAARADLIDDGIDMGAEKGGKTPRQIRYEKVATARRQYEPYYPVYGVFFLGFGVLIVFNVVLLTLTRQFSPAAGILLLAHLAVGSQTFIDYFFPTPQLLQFLLLGLIVLFARRYKMRFAALAEHYRDPIPLQPHYDQVRNEALDSPPTTEPPVEFTPLVVSHLTRWNTGPKKPLVMVCVSGGGSRAAAWTMKVLTELERRLATEKNVAFPYHVRMISGASGGIFGASYYAASLPPPDKHRLPDIAVEPLPAAKSGRYPSRRHLNESVRRDFLSPVVRALVQNDLLRQFQPFQFGGDRGAALEGAWSECLGGWLDQSFADLWTGERDGWRPSLAFSPMLVEDGRQLVISNLSLRRAMVNLGRAPDGTNSVLSREGIEFFKLFALDGRDPVAVRKAFRLATAARMSATFPYVFPAVPLPTTPRRRVVDAGYYDNYGTSLAAGWLFTHIGWLKERVSHVAVVHIRDGVSTNEREMLAPARDDTTAVGLAAEGLTTPPDGLWSMRSATNTFRNDNLLHLLNLFFREHEMPFVTTAFEFPSGDDVSLNFCLPESEAELIDGPKGIDHPDVKQTLDAFVNWWPTG